MDEQLEFLSEETILQFHAKQTNLFGGPDGLRDPDGLSAAVAQPQQVSFYRKDATIFDIATEYAFHISMRQAFLDGNKRTALQSALTFLSMNGYEVETDELHLFEAMSKLYEGPHAKAAFSEHLRKCSVRTGGFVQWLKNFLR